MGNSIYLGGGIKSAFCGGNVKEIWQGSNKIFGGGGNGLVIDGYEYATILMPDGRLWSAENIHAEQGGACYYNNDEETYGPSGQNKGRLYNPNEAKGIESRVNGWHLPTSLEWETLLSSVGGSTNKLKTTSGWWNNRNGTDDYGFSIKPCGYFLNASSFRAYNEICDFWIFDKGSTKRLRFNVNSVYDYGSYGETTKISVRLIKDI